MVRHYEQSLHHAINIPSSTLQEGISRGKTADRKLWRNSVLTPEQEESIPKHVTLLTEMIHGVNPVQLRRVAF